jgi:hypothetical protein
VIDQLGVRKHIIDGGQKLGIEVISNRVKEFVQDGLRV